MWRERNKNPTDDTVALKCVGRYFQDTDKESLLEWVACPSGANWTIRCRHYTKKGTVISIERPFRTEGNKKAPPVRDAFIVCLSEDC
jgi:hypothetical protein